MNLTTVRVEIPDDANVIIGQSHFIKTVEDLYEVMVGNVPGGSFGLAFCEASGPCLVRADGNDEVLREVAIRNASAIGAGHTFIILMKGLFPINVLNAVKNCPEVCRIFCATANPVEVVVCETEQGRGVIGVVDGSSPKGIEGDSDVAARKDFLRTIGYKR